MSKNSNISIRAWILFTLFSLIGITILAKVFIIQMSNHEEWDQTSSQLDKKVMTITPTRGRILSSDGSILAITVPQYSLYWDAKTEGANMDDFDTYKDTIVQTLNSMFPEYSMDELHKKFESARKKGSRYMKIVEEIDYDQKNILKKLPYLKRSQFKNGFIFDETTIRQKFFGELASRTIGRTTKDSLKGTVGLELSYNEELAGIEGKQMKVRIPGGYWKPLSDNYISEPREGSDLISTIDIHLQDLVQTSLKASLEENQAEWGCAILMEVATGEVKGISSLSLNKNGEYTESLNRAIRASSDPGSTFKLPVIMTCLEHDLIHIDDSIDTENGYMRLYDKDIRDTEAHGNGTVANMLQWSSNVGLTKIVKQCYDKDKQKLLDNLHAMGIGEPLGIEIPGETPPVIHKSINEDSWSGISHAQMALGYEVSMTPLQVLAFYNAVANNGKLIRPKFAKELRQNNKTTKVFETVTLKEKICSSETIEQAQHMLNMVCQEKGGTGYSTFKNKPYKVAGKTGTAWVYDEETKKYIIGDYRGSFAGYFPAEDPKYSCIVVINKPTSGKYYGSTVAAPVFREIADIIFASKANEMADGSELGESNDRITPISLNGSTEDLNILYKEYNIPIEGELNSEWSSVKTGQNGVTLSNIPTDNMRIPNVKGMAVKDAIFLLENMGLEVEIEGQGVIKKQSPEKGKPLDQYKRIKLTLN